MEFHIYAATGYEGQRARELPPVFAAFADDAAVTAMVVNLVTPLATPLDAVEVHGPDGFQLS